MFEKCRLTSDYTFGRGLWYKNRHYTIDSNMDFVRKHNLEKIAQVISPNGNTFDIFHGFGKSVLGSYMEFECAVHTGRIG